MRARGAAAAAVLPSERRLRQATPGSGSACRSAAEGTRENLSK